MEFKGIETEMYAVTYGGIVFIQDSEFYEDSEKCNVLDADHVGLIKAEANGLLFSKSYELLVNLNISNEMIRGILHLLGDRMAMTTKFGLSAQIEANDKLIKEATEI